jgi:hypothetical protein
MNSTRLTVVALCVAANAIAVSGAGHADSDTRRYGAGFHARFVPADGVAEVKITIRQAAGELIRLDLAAPPSTYQDFVADGSLERTGNRVVWEVPPEGGVLTYRAVIDHRRDQESDAASYDARMTNQLALLRLGDMFPPARARSRVDAKSASTLSLAGPDGWSFESRYGAAGQSIPIDDPLRRFDRPTGWLVAGEIGVRREIIEDRRVAIAAPTGEGVRRIDTLAFLRWTLPTLIEVFPEFPQRLMIASAGSPMWRGGLSGPSSLFLHANRPLISENGTSTMLHELVHVATGARFAGAADWIVEGLAEYYALEILRRSGGLSERRFQRALESLRAWVDTADGRLREPSRGADTARAVLVWYALANELNAGGTSMDSVVARLPASGPLDLAQLQMVVAAELGAPSRVLAAIGGVEEDR